VGCDQVKRGEDSGSRELPVCMFVMGNGDEVLIADKKKQSRENGQSESRLEPGEPAGGRDNGWRNRRYRNSRDAEWFRSLAAVAQKIGGGAKIGGALGAGKVVLFKIIAEIGGEFAEKIFFTRLGLNRFVVVHRSPFHVAI